MSLLNLVRKDIVIKFAETAKKQFDPEVSYAFHLSGVDAMGFLLIQDLKPVSATQLEIASDAFWINKDLVREIHELDLTKVKETIHYHGSTATTKVTPKAPVAPVVQPEAAKPEPTKAAAPKASKKSK